MQVLINFIWWFYTAVCVPRSPRRPIGFHSLLSDNVWWVRWYASCQWNCRGHYLINPNKALLWGKSLKITLYLHCLIPPKIGNLMTPALVVAFFMQRLCQNSSEKTWRKEKKKRHVYEIFWWGGAEHNINTLWRKTHLENFQSRIWCLDTDSKTSGFKRHSQEAGPQKETIVCQPSIFRCVCC